MTRLTDAELAELARMHYQGSSTALKDNLPDLLADLIAAREALRKVGALIEEAHKEYADGPILDKAQEIIKEALGGRDQDESHV